MPSSKDVKALIAGSSYYMNSCLQNLSAKLAGELEEHSFYADDMDPELFYTTAFTQSLFSDGKLIRLYRTELLKKPELVFRRELVSAPNAIIILTEDTKKGQGLTKFLVGFETFIEGKRNTSALIKEIVRIFGDKELSLNEQAAERIGTDMNWDMAEISSFATKLSLYFAGKKPTVQEILAHITSGAEEDIFRFIDAFMSRNKEKTIKIYASLKEPENECSRIFYMLVMYLAGLYYKLKLPALADGSNPLFNGKTYFMRTVDGVIKKWDASCVTMLIEEMRILEVAVKTGRISLADALIVLTGKL